VLKTLFHTNVSFTKRGLSMLNKTCKGRLHHGQKVIQERHRHRYEVNPEYIERIEAKGLKFVAKDEMGVRMIIIETKVWLCLVMKF